MAPALALAPEAYTPGGVVGLDLAGLLEAAARAGAPGEAAALYKAWIAHQAEGPGLAVAYFNYAVCLSDAGDLAGAVHALRAALRLQPGFAPPAINLGGVLERLGLPGPAVQAWLDLVHALPEVTGEAVGYKTLALKQVGRVLEAAQQDDAAEDALRQSLALNPAQPDVIQHLVALRQRQCKWPVLDGDGAQVARLRAGMSPLSAACLVDDPVLHLAVAHHYARTSIGRVPRLPAPSTLREAGKLRIGYVSSDLREHAVGFALAEMMALHDRSRVFVHAYYSGVPGEPGVPGGDATQRRIRAAVDRWTDVAGLDDAQAAQVIRRDGIDILVDLNGYTKDARTRVFGMRPAPVAVNWFGFPGTMGTAYHHYLIADAQVIPAEAEAYYTERVVRLPCYQPNDRGRVVAARPGRVEAGLPEQGFVFCSFNGSQKLTQDVFGRWMAILRAVPGSVLWLLSAAAPVHVRLQETAWSLGVDPARLIFAPKLANPQHLARIGLADLFLDSFPYGAHTTASDALWVGLPVLTLRGRSFAARVCASLVVAAGVPELACDTAEGYVAQAVALATSGIELAAIRRRLTEERDRCVLFDTPGLVRSLEGLFDGMQADRVAGRLPRPDLRNLAATHEAATEAGFTLPDGISDAEYLGRYRTQLAAWHEDGMLGADGRAWCSASEAA